jgi:hypothetical protein
MRLMATLRYLMGQARGAAMLLRALAVAALLFVVPSAFGYAVSVSPMSVFLDHRTRSGTMTLYNPNPLPEEIEIGFAFGYPQSDSLGNVTVPLSDSVPANEPGALPWLRAFPKKLILQPGQQQVVRILATPPENLADGEYWSRVLVTATGGRPPVEQQVQPDVRVAISMRTIVVASLNYRKGKPTTGIKVTQASAVPVDKGVQLTIDMERQGDAAFLGRIRVELHDRTGKMIAQDEDVVSVYRSLRRRLVLPVTDPATLAGARIRYILDTVRPELGQSNIIAAPAVEGTAEIR